MTRRELALLVRDEASYRLEVLWRLEQMAWQTKQTAEAVNRLVEAVTGGGGKTELSRKHLFLT